MSTVAVNPSKPANERVIDACVELLDAGRPLSEIITEGEAPLGGSAAGPGVNSHGATGGRAKKRGCLP